MKGRQINGRIGAPILYKVVTFSASRAHQPVLHKTICDPSPIVEMNGVLALCRPEAMLTLDYNSIINMLHTHRNHRCIMGT